MILANNISFSYGKLNIINSLNLHVKEGEFISIVGASGSGKTTLLQLLGTLEKISSGDLLINNQSVNNLTETQLSHFRNQTVGFVFQFHNLLAEFSALENVCLPAYIAKTNKQQAEKKAKELLSRLGMEQRMHHKPSQLSGGEQQRIAVARAMINSPAIILADEPSGNLDSKNADELHQLFYQLNKENGQTIVVVTHNWDLAKMTTRTLKMEDGKLID